ncbi:hypothetical protein R6Q59_000040 [Mikania micrantha]
MGRDLEAISLQERQKAIRQIVGGDYKGYLVEKYREDDSQHPRFDEPLWSRASQATGGKNKGKLYGLCNISDPLGFITCTQSTSCNSSSCGHERQDSEIFDAFVYLMLLDI